MGQLNILTLRLVLVAVVGVGAGQAAQHHHPRHEAEIGVRFTGVNKLVHLIGLGEVPFRWPGFADRQGRAGQISYGFGNGNQAVSFVSHGFILPCSPDKTGAPLSKQTIIEVVSTHRRNTLP